MKKVLCVILTICLAVATAWFAFAEDAESMDVSAYAAAIDNATIDASIYLDYAAGIEADDPIQYCGSFPNRDDHI